MKKVISERSAYVKKSFPKSKEETDLIKIIVDENMVSFQLDFKFNFFFLNLNLFCLYIDIFIYIFI